MKGFSHIACVLCAAALLLPASLRAAPAPAPRAPAGVRPAPIAGQILSVDLRSAPARSAPSRSGASVPSLFDADGASGPRQSVEVVWFACAPGIPPGALLLLDLRSRYSPSIRSVPFQTSGKSEGRIRTVFPVPSEFSPVAAWRVRLVWRGRLLAQAASPGWTP